MKKAYTATLLILLVFSLIKCSGNGNERLDDIKRQERASGNYC